MEASCKALKMEISRLTSICSMGQEASLDTCARHNSLHCTFPSRFIKPRSITIVNECRCPHVLTLRKKENEENDGADRSHERKRLRSLVYEHSRSDERERLALPIRHDTPLELFTDLDGAEQVLPSPVHHDVNGKLQLGLSTVKAHHSAFCIDHCCDLH
jgi:hypothetical protein